MTNSSTMPANILPRRRKENEMTFEISLTSSRIPTAGSMALIGSLLTLSIQFFSKKGKNLFR